MDSFQSVWSLLYKGPRQGLSSSTGLYSQSYHQLRGYLGMWTVFLLQECVPLPQAPLSCTTCLSSLVSFPNQCPWIRASVWRILSTFRLYACNMMTEVFPMKTSLACIFKYWVWGGSGGNVSAISRVELRATKST